MIPSLDRGFSQILNSYRPSEAIDLSTGEILCAWYRPIGMELDRFSLRDERALGNADTVVTLAPKRLSESLATPPESSSDQVATEVQEILGLTASEMASLVGVSDRGFRNWTTGASRIRLSNKKRLLWLKKILGWIAKARGVDGLREWLYSPSSSLQLRTPAELIAEGQLETVAKSVQGLLHAAPARVLSMVEARSRAFPISAFELDSEELDELENRPDV
jgi:hypothetical protein